MGPLQADSKRLLKSKIKRRVIASPQHHQKYTPHHEDIFRCRNCGREVVSGGAGTGHRNHCPSCLHSVHIDIEPGDRQADCNGLMEPVSVWVRKNGEWAIVHRCRDCGAFSSNRIAADDNEYALLSIAVKPLANPPFPLDKLPD